MWQLRFKLLVSGAICSMVISSLSSNLVSAEELAATQAKHSVTEAETPTPKPVIGINLDMGSKPHEASIPTYYFEAVEKSGGLPVLLPPMPVADIPYALSKLNGLLLIGGDDYPPALYGENPEPTVSIMVKTRADFDVALAKAALATPDMPILGVCAGCQVINITSGGSLIQDIPSHHPESNVVHGGPYDAKVGAHLHRVSFEKDSLLSKIYGGTPLTVPTSHHQCVGKVGQELTVVAHSDDGLPEAIEKVGGRFVVGVQWHPERDFDHNKELFSEFIRNAAKSRAKTSATPAEK